MTTKTAAHLPTPISHCCADAPCARSNREVNNNDKHGEHVSAKLDAARLQQRYPDQGERRYDHTMNSEYAVFDYERAKFLVLNRDLPFRTHVGMHLAANCLAVEITEGTRRSADRM
jgi:hypothetical protein